MKDRYCYWSVVDGVYSRMMQAVVDSARRVGVFKDFHVWTDEPVRGAVSHPVESFDKELYQSSPYAGPVKGTLDSIAAVPRDAASNFHRDYYVPNNAVLCIVGNIDAARTRELVARYFDSIPPGPDIPLPPRPSFRRENDAVVRSVGIRSESAGFHMGFRFFPLQPGDAECLRILATTPPASARARAT